MDAFEVGFGALARVLDNDKLLDEEPAVLSVATLDRRRLNSVERDAMDERRRREVRRELERFVSDEPLLREGIVAPRGCGVRRRYEVRNGQELFPQNDEWLFPCA